MKIEVNLSCPEFSSFRSEQTRSLFNVPPEKGRSHQASVDLPLDDEWSIGVIVGASGTGKSTLGKSLGYYYHESFEWDSLKPIIDQIAVNEPFTECTQHLVSAGLGTVHSWLKPYHVLSTGEKFRADLARILSSDIENIVIDEFTSVVDRNVAKTASVAFAKSWRRNSNRKAILLSCHFDVLEYLEPDWVLDTNTWELHRRQLRRPDINIEIYESFKPEYWKLFREYHYLNLPDPVANTYYVGHFEDKPICHVGISTNKGCASGRFNRLVVIPQYQGLGIGTKLLEYVGSNWLKGINRYNKKMTSIACTGHSGLIRSFLRRESWVHIATHVGGRTKSANEKANNKRSLSGHGNHLRGLASFRYIGNP